MIIPEILKSLEGEWQGTNRLYMEWTPENPIRDSESVATVSLAAGGHFLEIEYDWVFDGNRQEGMLLVSVGKESDAQTAWIDSFHQSGGFMVSKGNLLETTVDVSGSYSVPGHPDWGWRTIFETSGPDEFTITMYNLSPEGVQHNAVEAKYERVK